MTIDQLKIAAKVFRTAIGERSLNDDQAIKLFKECAVAVLEQSKLL